MTFRPRPGPLNLISDVPGISVGQSEDHALRTGVTVILPRAACPAAADVRGGGPGTREIDALSPENVMGAADAVVLSGGSALGLGAGDAVAAALSAAGRGMQVGPGHPPVPIVPGAIIYDLGPHLAQAFAAGGPPHPALARQALDAALAAEAGGARGFALGAHGAGRGAKAGALKGGIGSASLEVAPGLIVGAVMAANPVGSPCMPGGGPFWAWPWEIGAEFGGARPGPDWAGDAAPLPGDTKMAVDPAALWDGAAAEGPEAAQPGANTAIGAVAVNADLTTAECKRLAMMAQDGIARAVRPSHMLMDGDTIFALAPGGVALGAGRLRTARLSALGSAMADCVARAIARAVFEAEADPDGPPSWRAARG